jgi:6-pyruvoyl-tetrahydropterin synthase
MNISAPLKTKLILNFQFIASHALSVRETPHDHLWRVQATIAGEPQAGMILNMVDVRQQFMGAIAPLTDSHLNDNPHLLAQAAQTPTCETLAAHFYSAFSEILDREFLAQNPSVQLSAIEVELHEPNGHEWGSARLERS